MTAKKTTVKTTPDPSVAWAEKLWERLHTTLIDTQKTIIEIIQARAWEPLGYESFAKAWVDRMADVQIGIELQPHVVYELLNEQMPLDQIAEMLSGVGPETVNNLARERENGVPPEYAKGRSSRPRPRSAPATLFLHLGKERYAQWADRAASIERSVEDIAVEVLDRHFSGIGEQSE